MDSLVLTPEDPIREMLRIEDFITLLSIEKKNSYAKILISGYVFNHLNNCNNEECVLRNFYLFTPDNFNDNEENIYESFEKMNFKLLNEFICKQYMNVITM